MQAIIDRLSEAVHRAAEHGERLCIRGSGSKDFYGGTLSGTVLDVTPYCGIVDYEPKELVLTARAGTPLAEIEKTLEENGQMFPFEPPHFGSGATLGGCVAAGLSGPRRAYAGAVRDFVLGVRMLDGRGDDLSFGGQVMKNVAGYDVPRLMAGSLGTLGVLLEVSLKVLPRPRQERTLSFEMDEARAIAAMNTWAARPLPISATSHVQGVLTVRLSGAASAIKAAQTEMGGEVLDDGAVFWKNVREQTADFFGSGRPLWRVSLPSTAQPLNLPGRQLIEWGGALRWVATDVDVDALRRNAVQMGGQATLFRGGDKTAGAFHPLSPALLNIHKRLKQTFDPHGIFNPGRMVDAF